MAHALDPVTEPILQAAIAVHRALGPGLLESVYQRALADELEACGIGVAREVPLAFEYRKRKYERAYIIDLLVGGRVVVEVKAVEALTAIHLAQLMTYLKLSGHEVGLLLNFNTVLMKDGIRRVFPPARRGTDPHLRATSGPTVPSE